MARTPNIDLREDYGRNYIINGNFDFWQRGTSLTGLTGSGTNYLADRFSLFRNTSATLRMDRDTDTPTITQSGNASNYSLKVECTATGALNTSINIFYAIEGNDWASLFTKSMTISFWVKSSVPGDYGVALRNTVDRSFADVITINQANTWEKKSLVIPADNLGTYNFDNSLGAQLSITLANAAAGNEHGNLGGWENSNAVTSSTQVNGMSTAGNVFKIAQVQLTEGTEALSFRRAGRTIGEELHLCERYFQIYESSEVLGSGHAGTASLAYCAFNYKTEMRTTPIINQGGVARPVRVQRATGSRFCNIDSVSGGSEIGSVLILASFDTADLTTGHGLTISVAVSGFIELDAEL